MTATQVAADAVGFADGNAGHVYTYPSGAPSVGQLDIFEIASDTVVSTPSGFSVAKTFVSEQGSYIFYRFAVGGEAATTTITTSGDFNTSVMWSRWNNCLALDVAVEAHVDNVDGVTTPAVSTGTLAQANELVVVLAALHQGTPNTFVPSAGYTAMGPTPVTQGASGSSATAAASYRVDGGTASESPSISWTNNANDRYILVATFTTSSFTATITPDGLSVATTFGDPTVTDTATSVAPDSLSIPATLGAPTVTDTTTSVAPDSLSIPVTLGDPDLNLSAATISPDPMSIPVTLGPPTVQTLSAGDTLLLPYAQTLLACLCTALSSLPNPPDICCIRAGDSVIQDIGPFFDECCDGQAYVRIVGFYPTGYQNSPFPSPSTDFGINACGVPAWGLQLEMGVFRCMNTESVTCPEWGQVAAQQMADAKAMRLALCCFIQGLDPGTVSIGTWTPSGREGGCIGGTLALSVEVLNCEDC